MSEFYHECAFPKPELRKKVKARKDRVHADHVAETRVHAFGRERGICRCCRCRPAESMHEIKGRGIGGRVSKRNSIAVCGKLVGTEPSCHTYLQQYQIECEALSSRGAEGTLVFIPKTQRAADWMRVKLGERVESPVMHEIAERS